MMFNIFTHFLRTFYPQLEKGEFLLPILYCTLFFPLVHMYIWQERLWWYWYMDCYANSPYWKNKNTQWENHKCFWINQSETHMFGLGWVLVLCTQYYSILKRHTQILLLVWFFIKILCFFPTHGHAGQVKQAFTHHVDLCQGYKTRFLFTICITITMSCVWRSNSLTQLNPHKQQAIVFFGWLM